MLSRATCSSILVFGEIKCFPSNSDFCFEIETLGENCISTMKTLKENLRKCIKCGSSPSQDPSINLHRFPKPGTTNSLRCELWAKYCFPNDLWSSPEYQGKLHSLHKMLCNKHFTKTCFVGRQLFRTATPGLACDEIINSTFGPLEPSSVFVPVAGPSRITQPLMANINVLNTSNMTVQHVPRQIDEQALKPVAVSAKQSQNSKERHLYIKMRRNMKKVYKTSKNN